MFSLSTDQGTKRGAALPLVPAALAVSAVVLWAFMVVPGHPWGDDWAGYLLQARALAEGATAAEVAANAALMRGSDVQLGPDAYPWGYPALLAVVGLATDWDFESLKLVGLVALVGTALATFGLVRLLAGLWLAVVAAVLVAFRPSVVIESTYLGSDLPFLAISTLALGLIVRVFARVRRTGGMVHPTVLLGVAVLSAAAFSIRSNGIVLPATFVFAFLLLCILGNVRWSMAAASSSVFGAFFGVAALVYLLALPDGSLGSVSYVSFDPTVWGRACISHANYIAAFVTLDLIRGPAKLIPLALFIAICALGFLRRREEAAILLFYLFLHIGLITLVPFQGGERYYYPMLPPAFALFALGLEAVSERTRGPNAAAIAPASRRAAAAVSAICTAILVLALASLTRVGRDFNADSGTGTPLAADTLQAFRYVSASAPAGARIAFFKPRAFRLATDRQAVAVRQPQNLARVDWYVFNGAGAGSLTQLDERFLAEASSGFTLRYSVGPYRVYARGAR